MSHVLWGIREDSDNTSKTWLVFNEIGNLLIILNASINIIPYYVFSRKFRIVFTHIFFDWIYMLCWKKSHLQPNKYSFRNRPITRPSLHDSEAYVGMVLDNCRTREVWRFRERRKDSPISSPSSRQIILLCKVNLLRISAAMRKEICPLCCLIWVFSLKLIYFCALILYYSLINTN